MGKSRVEKNKKLYDELDSTDMTHHGLDLDAFELEDLGDLSDKEKEAVIEDLGDLADKEKENFELEDLGDLSDKERDNFELTDLTDTPPVAPAKTEQPVTEPVVEPVVENKVIVKDEPKAKTKKEKKKLPMVKGKNDVNVEQPLSYNKLLKAEEILRAKFERQKELRDSRRGHKRSPVTDNYTAEMMQKNIKQSTGVDVRKELNIKIRKTNGRAITLLAILLMVIVAVGVALSIVILRS